MLRTIVFVAPVAVSTVVIRSSFGIPDHRHVAIAFDGIVLPQRMSFPVVWQQDAPQVGMPREAYAEKVKNLAFQPICPRPDGNQRIHNCVRTGQANLETDFVAAGNRNQVVVQFETRLAGIAVNAGGIGNQVKLQLRVIATALGHGTQDFARQNERGLAAKFNHFLDRVWIPRTQVLGHNTSALAGILSHRFEALRRRLILVPVQRAFFPKIEVTHQKYGDVYHHFQEAVHAYARRHVNKVPIDVGPRI